MYAPHWCWCWFVCLLNTFYWKTILELKIELKKRWDLQIDWGGCFSSRHSVWSSCCHRGLRCLPLKCLDVQRIHLHLFEFYLRLLSVSSVGVSLWRIGIQTHFWLSWLHHAWSIMHKTNTSNVHNKHKTRLGECTGSDLSSLDGVLFQLPVLCVVYNTLMEVPCLCGERSGSDTALPQPYVVCSLIQPGFRGDPVTPESMHGLHPQGGYFPLECALAHSLGHPHTWQPLLFTGCTYSYNGHFLGQPSLCATASSPAEAYMCYAALTGVLRKLGCIPKGSLSPPATPSETDLWSVVSQVSRSRFLIRDQCGWGQQGREWVVWD